MQALRRRRSYKSKRGGLKRTIYRVLKNSAESKWVGQNWNDATVGSTTGSFQDMTYLAQGTGQHDRVGNRINPTKLRVSFVFHLANATGYGNAQTITRCIVGIARGISLTSASMPSVYAACDTDLFYVLSDTYHHVTHTITAQTGGNTVSGEGSTSSQCQLTIPLKHITYYDDATQTPSQGQVFIYMLSQTTDTLVLGNAQLYFKDF